MTILALTVCAPEASDSFPGQEAGEPLSPMEADEVLSLLEEKLLALPGVEVRYRITSEGAFAAELEGALRLAGDQGASLRGEGSFGGEPVTLSLSASEGRMTGGNREGTFEGSVSPGLREALVIGLTRMGLLHNLARLVAGSPPDRADGADGAVREWVEVREVSWAASTEDAPGSRGIHFHIWVAGQPAGEATLWLGEGGLPVFREQVVRFPGGEMRVVERYKVE